MTPGAALSGSSAASRSNRQVAAPSTVGLGDGVNWAPALNWQDRLVMAVEQSVQAVLPIRSLALGLRALEAVHRDGDCEDRDEQKTDNDRRRYDEGGGYWIDVAPRERGRNDRDDGR